MIGLVLGKYRIIGHLGAGGMGTVYMAQHTGTERLVALKVLHPQYSPQHSKNTGHVERLFREARAAAALFHPAIPQVYDMGHHHDGRAYIAMELLRGQPLNARLRAVRRIPYLQALAMTQQIAGALAAAHAQGIVHRDIKPDNIFLAADPDMPGGERIRILDFGLVRLTHDLAASPLTRTGALLGTPHYMAPEQCKAAKSVDHRADLYSLGCTLFEMVCGQPPFHGDSPGAILHAHIHQDPPRPSTLEPSLPPELDTLVLRLLAKDPAARYQSATEVIQAIARINAAPSHHRIATEAATHSMAGSHTPSAQPHDKTLLAPSHSDAATHHHAFTDPDIAPAVSVPSARDVKTTASTSPRSRSFLMGGAVLGIGGAVLLTLAALQKNGASASPAAPTLPTAAADAAAPVALVVPAASPALPAAEAADVTITIQSTPPGAYVYRELGDVRLGITPYIHTMKPVDGELVLMIRHKDYEDKPIAIPANQTGSYTFALAPAKRASRRQAPPKNRTTQSTATQDAAKHESKPNPDVLNPFE